MSAGSHCDCRRSHRTPAGSCNHIWLSSSYNSNNPKKYYFRTKRTGNPSLGHQSKRLKWSAYSNIIAAKIRLFFLSPSCYMKKDWLTRLSRASQSQVALFAFTNLKPTIISFVPSSFSSCLAVPGHPWPSMTTSNCKIHNNLCKRAAWPYPRI